MGIYCGGKVALIDLHSHILPGIDDGPEDIYGAVEMAGMAARDGVRIMVATPHYASGLYENGPDIVDAGVAALNEVLAGENINLTVLPGMEIRVNPDAARMYREGGLISLNRRGRHVLLDFPLITFPLHLDRVIFDMQLAGATVIIAHPERNKEICKCPEMLYPVLERGVLVQVNAGSLTGEFGPGAQRSAELFLKLGWVSFIATDAHSARYRRPGLSAAVEAAGRIVGKEKARVLVATNPERVIQGLPVSGCKVMPYENKKSRFSVFFSWLKG